MSKFKHYRKSKNLTQAQIARQFGLAQSTVSDIETGRRNLHPLKAIIVEELTGGELSRQDIRPDIYKR